MSQRPDVYTEDGVTFFRASSIGACTRGLVACRLGVQPQPPTEKLAGYMEDSSLAEEVVRTQLVRKGYGIEGDQDEVFLDLPEGRITGHVDGYGEIAPHGRFVLEIKAFGRTLFEKYAKGGLQGLGPPFTRMYEMQVSAYMVATGLPALMVVHGKEHGLTMEKWVEEPFYDEDQLRWRLSEIQEWAQEGKYPPCDAKCGPWSWYWWVHEQRKETAVGDEELGSKLAKLTKLKEQKKLIDAEHDALRDEIREEVGHGTLTASGYSVTVARFMKKMTDYERMRRDLGDEFFAAYEYQKEEARVTVKKERGN